MSGIQQQLLGGPFGVAAYQIQRSLRFNSADTTYLSRAITSTSDRRKFTFSCWTKIGYIGSNQKILLASTDNASETSWIWFNAVSGRGSASCLSFETQSPTATVTTSAVFRDPSAWYHIVVAVDTTQATDSNRVKIYVNNVQQTLTGTYPAQNKDTVFNTSGYTHGVGAYWTGTLGPYDGYMAEMYWVDGQQLTPSSFGQTNAATGVWEPIAYTGTYGTNGFYVNFSDNSGTTSTTLGKDYSGNSNNYTPNNFSVTAGVGNDSLVDTPTSYGTDTGAGGEVRGNYATLNPLITPTTMTIVNGNLDLSGYTAVTSAYGTFGMSSGKWYFEYVVYANGMGGISGTPNGASYPGQSSDSYAWDASNAGKYNNGIFASYGNATSNGDIVGVAFDADAGTLVFYKNGVSQGTAYSSIPSKTYFPVFRNANSGGNLSINFGQRPFAYTAPSGFKALVTQNLSTPTIVQPDDYFNTVLYTGNGSTQTVSGVGFQPDLVWNKQRSSSVGSNWLNDAVRTAGYSLSSNRTDAEANFTAYFTAFNSDGFNLAGGTDGFNANTSTYVAWCWKANGAGSSNTAGTISSTVSANTTSGFSIVTYTGTGSNATVGHGLGATPSMIIVKKRSSATTSNWVIYFSALSNAATSYLFLNTTDAVTGGNTILWNSTAPTSTVFSVGTASNTNASSETYVAYCFAPIAGFSAFGSYTGNGSSDGPFVYLGFRPEFIMIKRTDVANDWIMYDNAREPYNFLQSRLYANLSDAENSNTAHAIDFLSNGIKFRASTAAMNASSGTYIYAAFAENPFKYSLAR